MDDGRWRQIEEITLAALELPEAEREGFVAASCGVDNVLRDEVVSFLRHDTDDSFLHREGLAEIATSFLDNEEPELIGKRLGHYQIIKEIGRGGMGAVYLAERADGEVEQQVAIKIVRQTIVEKELISHFRRERQILASLNHPNIARFLDGGVAPTGEPFLVMEYVEGKTLVDYAEHCAVSVDERLRLFLDVCAAVAFAHRNLVVHRDLKPSNILVTADGSVKLLDFGLAKAIEAGAAEDDLKQTALRALTPHYASPEQVRGDNVTTASDIYSLGVVLSELLDGRTAGDLKNIADVARRDEPEQRYRSVEALAEDIGHFLKGEPVAARPATFRYRSAKFIKRHRVGVAAAAVVVLSLISGVAVSSWQARQARLAKARAESVNVFLERMFKYANPIYSSYQKGGRSLTINDVVDEAAKRLDSGEFDGQPEVKTQLEHTLVATYIGQGNLPAACRRIEKYRPLVAELYGEDDPRTMEAMTNWAGCLFATDKMADGESLYRQYLPKLRVQEEKGTIKAEVLASALNDFGYVRRTQGDSKEAEALFRESLDLNSKISSDEVNFVNATTRSVLASTLADQGRFDEAVETAREAVAEQAARGETNSPTYGFNLTVLAGFLTEKGELAAASDDLRNAETIFRRELSPSHLWLGDNLRNQAFVLYEQGSYEAAVAKADETLKIYTELIGPHYDNYPTALIVKGLSLAKMGELREGEQLLRDALKLRTDALPTEHYWVAMAKGALGECLVLEKRSDEAAPLIKESYESLERSLGENDPRTLLAKQRLALVPN